MLNGGETVTVNYEDLGKRIRRKRSENHISQAALAEMIQVSVQHMSNVENAKTKVSLETVIEIANALDCSLDELVCGSLKKQSRQIYQDEVALLLEVMQDSELKIMPDVLKNIDYIYRTGVKSAQKEND